MITVMQVHQPSDTCSVDWCDRPRESKKKNYCPMHQRRVDRHGDVESRREQDLDGMRLCRGACGEVKPIDQFYTQRRVCKKCKSEYDRQWCEQNAEHMAEWYREYNQKPERKEKCRGRAIKRYYGTKEREQTNGTPPSIRDRRLHNYYGLGVVTPDGMYVPGSAIEEYDRRFEAQNGCCAICDKPETGKDAAGNPARLRVDHDHNAPCNGTEHPPKKGCRRCIRGLLCIKHNLGLYFFRDNPDELFASAKYLLKYTLRLATEHYRTAKERDVVYARRFEAQLGCCAICEQSETAQNQGKTRRLCADHDHRCCLKGCGRCDRGLLCHRHNRGLGYFHDDPDELLSAAEYLLKHLDAPRPMLNH